MFDDVRKAIKRSTKASIRAKVVHLFHVVKNLFRHHMTRYKRLAKTLRSCFSYSACPISSWLADGCWTCEPKVRPEGENRQKNYRQIAHKIDLFQNFHQKNPGGFSAKPNCSAISEKFKIEAVKQVTDRGYSAPDVAKRLGVL